MYIDNDHHVLAVLNIQKRLSFYALLFGTFNGFVALSQDIWTGPELLTGKGVVFVIDCKARRMETFDYHEFVVKKMKDKGMLSS